MTSPFSAPFTQTVALDIPEVLQFIYGETSSSSSVRDFASSFLGLYGTGECDECGYEVPTIEIDDVDTCAVCRSTLSRSFTCTFTFSISVKAANPSDAESLAEDAVSVSVAEDDHISDNYDVEVSSVNEAW